MVLKFKEPEHKITLIIIKPIDTSYEIICAADLKAPKKGYLELLDQPAIMIPYTLNEETAKRYNTPILMSDNTEFLQKGITAHPNKLRTNVIIGAKRNKNTLELLGIIVSLANSFKPSDKG